ncbi:hypothetical protein [Aestuariispira insulae]|uniref:Uncharacterized protein n=1 Tax=Aestuariispira insulae TaxID=1461337 RepID=A0A3D9HWM5_9PROT|nr:hypothetical protein [Aestuariispira insulae]RED53810.1 hypothetical protein DFP90_101609 [Aestuariispira insulae]
MSKTLIEELADLKRVFAEDSAEADLIRRAMFMLDDQERVIGRLKDEQKQQGLLSPRGRHAMDKLQGLDLALGGKLQ